MSTKKNITKRRAVKAQFDMNVEQDRVREKARRKLEARLVKKVRLVESRREISLCNRFAIALQRYCSISALAPQSLSNRLEITLQSPQNY
jgi:hypothetical protein